MSTLRLYALLSLEIIYDVVLIFQTSAPKSCYQSSLFKELLRKYKARNKNIKLLASSSNVFEKIILLSWPSVHFLLGSSISSVVLFFVRKSPGNAPPASLVQAHRTMASHTCVSFSVFAVLRMMWF